MTHNDDPKACIGCGEENYVAHNVAICAVCKEVCQKQAEDTAAPDFTYVATDDLMAMPRRVLAMADHYISRHMEGNVRLDGDTLEWVLHMQRASRLYLFQLGAPEAEPFWGRWQQKRMGQTWGSTQP